LAQETQQHQHLPRQIGTDTNWASVTLGAYHSFAIRTTGTLWAWGMNTRGQLGLGYYTNTQILNLSRSWNSSVWTSVGGGLNRILATKNDGTLWAWGNNNSGALGLGNTTTRSSPVQVGTDTNWAFAATEAGGHTLALKTTGTLWAWGNNSNGRLGLGDTTNRSSPVQVGTDTDWYEASTNPKLVIKTNGEMWGAGSNNYGLIQPIVNNISSPVQVGTNANWDFIFADTVPSTTQVGHNSGGIRNAPE
jgi:alpha-tubulin suppressor-like RCC1 family protein